MADERILKRITSLLRLAAPSSNSTVAERESASLEAAKLIAEHGLVVAEAPPPVKKTRTRKQPAPEPTPWTPPPAPTPPPWSPPAPPQRSYNGYRPPVESYYGSRYYGSDWQGSTANKDCICCGCGKTIYRGEATWWDPAWGHRHHDIACS